MLLMIDEPTTSSMRTARKAMRAADISGRERGRTRAIHPGRLLVSLLILLCQIKILASDHVGKYNVIC
jgi:hypothetical protein